MLSAAMEVTKETKPQQKKNMQNLIPTNAVTLSAESKNERDFFRIASVSTALAFGAMVASVESLRRDAAGYSFQLSVGTAVAFAVGAAAGWLYWNLVARNAARRSTASLRAASLLLVLAGVGAFLYPLRFVSPENLADILKGLALDTVALGLVGVILWRIKRFLDQDSATRD